MVSGKPRKQPKWLDFRKANPRKYAAFFARNKIRGVELREIAPYEFHPVSMGSARMSVKKIVARRRKYVGRQEEGFFEHDYQHAYWLAVRDWLGFSMRAYSALSIMEEMAFPTLFLPHIEFKKTKNDLQEKVPFSAIKVELERTHDYIPEKARVLLQGVYPHFQNTRDFYRALFSLHRSREMNPFLHELNNVVCGEEMSLRNPNDHVRVNAIMIRILHFMERKSKLYEEQRKKGA